MPERRDETLEDRLRAALDRLPAPDLWRDAAAPGRPERPLPPASSPGRRIATAAFALVLFVGSMTFLLTRGGTSTVTSSAPPASTISVSKMLGKTLGIRCTASMPDVVQPGAPLDLGYTLENVTNAPVKVSLFPPSFPVRVRAGDGSTWDTADLMNHSWPMTLPTPLAPGATKTVAPQPLAVQFAGPLTVTPTCAGEPLPALHAAVADLGPTPPAEDAVARAAASASGLFDACLPPPDGAVVGTIAPPGGGGVSLEDIRCSARIESDPGFAVVTFAITTPSAAPAPSIPQGLLSTVDVPSADGNAETVVWRFVVTDSGAYPVGSTTHAKTVPADAMDTSYDITSEGWSAGDTSSCGGEDISWGGTGSSVTVVFFDACH
ncbi:MAG: hypothetical protein ACXVWF_00135 [Actinomycetota bacterium]